MNLKTYGIESLATDHLKTNELAQLSSDSATAALAFVKEHKGNHLLATHDTNLQTAQADFQAVKKEKSLPTWLRSWKKQTSLTYEEESPQLVRFFEQMVAPEKVVVLETLG